MAGNAVTVTVSGGTTTTVTVPGSTGTPAPTITNGGTANVAVTSVGDRGPKGDTGPANTLTIGTVTTGAAGSSASATLTGTAPSQTLSLVIPRGDAGQNIELQSTSTHLQWRNVGGSTWSDLVALTAIAGPQGSTGANGSSVELQTTSTHIQWRLAGGSTWTDLVALTAITGPQGSTGATGATGATGSFSDAQAINTQTASYTLTISDAGKLIAADHASTSITITVPAGSSVAFPVGTHIDIARLGVASVSVAAASGVTVNGAPGLNLRSRYSSATLIEISADNWLLVGDLSA